MSRAFTCKRSLTPRRTTSKVEYSDTGWQGMGLTQFTDTPHSHSSKALLVVAVLAALISVSAPCQINECWAQYSYALQHLGKSGMCIALRTYHQCTRNSASDCTGNIHYHSVRRMIESSLKKNNCSMTGKFFTGNVPKGYSHKSVEETPQECTFSPKAGYGHCGLFGDPHLRTFTNKYQTCKVRGAWPLIDNEYLTVQVTNDPVGKDSSATATSKLTVIIKKHEECGSDRYITYQAQTNNLPNRFQNGRSVFGYENSVRLVEVVEGRHIEIHIRYIDTTILVRQIGHYFTFSLQTPLELVQKMLNKTMDSGLNLCIKGCPKSEIIDYKHFLTKKNARLKSATDSATVTNQMTREQAIQKCKNTNVVDFYFDSCVFDLMTTGDSNFTQAANSAQQDILRFIPQVWGTFKNRTSLPVYVQTHKNSSNPLCISQIFYWIILLCTYLRLLTR